MKYLTQLNFINKIGIFLGLALIASLTSWGVLYFLPSLLVWNSISNADSLLLFDIANDLWNGKSLYGWNFPRASYIFPDLLIAFLPMMFGWSSSYTLMLVATVNFLLFILVVNKIVNSLNGGYQQSILSTALSLSAALFLFGVVLFPNSMPFIYWQLFASGAHFLTVIFIALIFSMVPSIHSIKLEKNKLIWVVILVFLVSLSNSMSVLLIGSWLTARMGWRFADRFFRFKSDSILSSVEIYIALALIAGTVLGAVIPRQSIAESFFSLKNFAVGIQGFVSWVLSDIANALLVVSLLLLTISWPIFNVILLRSEKNFSPHAYRERDAFFRNPYLLPSLSIFVFAPILYQGEGSLRYFAFPGLIALMSISVFLVFSFSRLIKFSKFGVGLLFAASISFLIISLWPRLPFVFEKKRTTTTHQMHLGQYYSGDAQDAVDCIEKASSLFSLSDGLATYWNARPIRVASNFKYFLAQVPPWNPSSGYFLWGNNGMDFIYADIFKKKLRNYNYIVASKAEVDAEIWGPVFNAASNKVECDDYLIFIFSDNNILQNYLFPKGRPNNINGR